MIRYTIERTGWKIEKQVKHALRFSNAEKFGREVMDEAGMDGLAVLKGYDEAGNLCLDMTILSSSVDLRETHSNGKSFYYVAGRRVTRQMYEFANDKNTRHECMWSRVRGEKVTHGKVARY